MPEQEEKQIEKKKAGIVKRILKWLGFGLLTLLLIASIIFQGPWKVTVLLGILAASFFLPKPYGKYFWLGVGGVAVALIIWVFLPEETEGWRPYTFDEELAVFEAKYAVPDRENAVIIYNQLLEDYNEAAFEPNFADPNLEELIGKEFWLSKDHPEATQWLGRQEGTIAKLIEASKIEQCRFPINADVAGISDMLDRLKLMRRWANLLISAANNDVAAGRVDQALEKYVAALQMGKHLRQQPAMVDLLVGIGLEVRPTSQLKRFIVEGDATEEHLNIIEQALAGIKRDWSYDLPRILDYEKLFAKNLCGLSYAVNPEGKIRLNPGVATRAMMARLPEEMKGKYVITYWRERLIKASNIWAWFYMPSTPQEAGEIIDSEYERLYVMAEPDFDWQPEVEKPAKMFQFNYRYLIERLTETLAPTYDGVHDTYLRHIAQQRGALLMIALRRYKNKTGHWPGSLDEVKSLATEETFVDPVNGGSFVYKLAEDNFKLYSKGKNNIDENGQYNYSWDPNNYKGKTEEDDIAIWPPKGYKKTKEEDASDK